MAEEKKIGEAARRRGELSCERQNESLPDAAGEADGADGGGGDDGGVDGGGGGADGADGGGGV